MPLTDEQLRVLLWETVEGYDMDIPSEVDGYWLAVGRFIRNHALEEAAQIADSYVNVSPMGKQPEWFESAEGISKEIRALKENNG